MSGTERKPKPSAYDFLRRLNEGFENGAVETRVVDPNTGGAKGQKQQRMELLPYDTLMWLAEHYARGANKYDDRNWELGYAWSLSMAALMRHLAAWWQGEDDDAETGSSHLQAVLFHAMSLATFSLRGLGTDDRPFTTAE